MFALVKMIFEPANWLTLVRLPLAAGLWLAPSGYSYLVGILGLAALSDMLDGRVAKYLRARRLDRGESREVVGRSHALGAWLDPFCDKVLVLSAIAVIYLSLRPALWIVFAVAAREIILVPFVLAYRFWPRLRRLFKLDFRAGGMGKLATVSQFVAILMLVLDTPGVEIAVVLTAGIGAIAAYRYIRKALRMARWLATNEFSYGQWLKIQGELGRP